MTQPARHRAFLELPPGSTFVNLLGVDYVHSRSEAGGDLYLTTHALPCAAHLRPASWYDLAWFRQHREPLVGTGSVYATISKPIDGECLGLVVKYCRVGQRVPGARDLHGEQVITGEFNSPFEEFALVEELRHGEGGHGSPDDAVHTQVPLAIYVPPERYQPSQMGRDSWRIEQKLERYPGVRIDILREYIMVYSWLPGVDLYEAHLMGLLPREEMERLAGLASAAIRARGFVVLDDKPEHVIVDLRPPGGVLQQRDGDVAWAVVDYELLERTPEHAQALREKRRRRFEERAAVARPDRRAALAATEGTELTPTRVMGVYYIYGEAGSTGGALWVLGDDPELFDYFLPERWRETPQVRLAIGHETYFTQSKDGLHLVWKVSRVGERPDTAALGLEGFRVLDHGFNSPFEEIAFACRLRRRGIPTIVPRAIYRTRRRVESRSTVFDPQRYESHRELKTPDGDPILGPDFNYITIWDHWNGVDPLIERRDGARRCHREALDAEQAIRRGVVTRAEAEVLVTELVETLAAAGIEAVRLATNHLLLSVDAGGLPLRDRGGRVVTRLCNLQYLRDA